MHQTIYIDIDEEITSIIDRLRKAKAKEIVIVVPKRALLIQSIITLKLLKKESERLKKEIIIVTQDKLGKLLVEKTGIPAENKLNDIGGAEINSSGKGLGDDAERDEVLSSIGLPAGDDKGRLENLGSAEYFDSSASIKKSAVADAGMVLGGDFIQKQEAEGGEKILNKELVTGISKDIKKKSAKSFSPVDIVKNVNMEQAEKNSYERDETVYIAKEKISKMGAKKDERIPSNSKEEKAGQFFSAMAKAPEKKQRDEYKNISVSKNIKKTFIFFAIAALAIIAVSGAYLFAPKADMKIFLKTKTKSLDVEIKGGVEILSVNPEQQAIPAKIAAISEELTKSFDATGKKSLNSQRAKGVITIYNEYSESQQPLVATTRFASEGGKVFRLVKGIIVPGTSKVGSEIKPGAIEAEVIADEPGEGYNIGASKFTIPGFQSSGTEKYSKIYAKSAKPMSGGGGSGETVKSVSAGDISNAKNKVAAELEKIIKQKIKESAGEKAVVLDDAINISDAVYTVSNSEGESAESFNITVKEKATAVIFFEDDAKAVGARLLSDIAGDGQEIRKESVTLQFGKSDADFSKDSILIRVNVSGKVAPKLDTNNLKKGILGKSEDDLMAYLKDFTEIDSVEINYWPAFMGGKIPSYEKRVNITLDPALTASN